MEGQAFSQNAKHAALALVFEKELPLQTHGQDMYGRTLAEVILQEGTNVSHELITALQLKFLVPSKRFIVAVLQSG